jgi:RNA polymerase sporulation-specific sigma factor
MKLSLKCNLVILWHKEFLGITEDELFYNKRSADTAPAPLQRGGLALIDRLDTDAEAKKILVEHNLRLVVYIAKKFENTSVGIEDLISIGTIGL